MGIKTEIKRGIGNTWVASRNGKEIARMFFDEQTQLYEIWSIFENDRIKTYKTLGRGLKALNAYLEE